MPRSLPALPLLAVVAVLASRGTARAQTDAAGLAPRPLASAAMTAAQTTPLAAAPARKRRNTVALGAAIGAVTAAALTAGVAATYGNNEGGEFCTACFVEWGAIAIPAGAGLGAGIGWIVKSSASPSQQPGLPPAGDATGRILQPRRKQLGLTLTF